MKNHYYTYDVLIALHNSIEHWKENENAETIDEISVKGGCCALCILFNNSSSETPCNGCPVIDKTGHKYCENSPYEGCRIEFYSQKYSSHPHNIDLRIFKRLAKLEREFLESLLP